MSTFFREQNIDQNISQTIDQKEVFETIVIGSGVAGAVAAHKLAKNGRTLVIDKARGSGGRLSSKRIPEDAAGSSSGSAALGCDAFTLSAQAFEQYFADLCVDSLDKQATGEAYICRVKGRSSAWTRSLLQGAETAFGERVVAMVKEEGMWQIHTQVVAEQTISNIHLARNVVVTAPPEQALALLSEAFRVRSNLQQVEHSACWLALVVLKSHEHIERQIEEFNDQLSPHSMGLVRCQVTERFEDSDGDEAVLLKLFADEAWSLEHANDDKADVMDNFILLLAQALAVSGEELRERMRFAHCHRWLYSRPLGRTCFKEAFKDLGDRLFLAGDYFCGETAGVESAMTSAAQLADFMAQVSDQESDNYQQAVHV